ncbi:uncharacterized protein LOC131501315 [Neofelis nebulosa]|uniref:uncharacterized protein LOC131501315 n=1 Tax=Neofelis nebulosa TaxID=61452 RepID=UPI00272DB447|nr:uncharacterized protein LOC131501315 [Neofelis nebulosa]
MKTPGMGVPTQSSEHLASKGSQTHDTTTGRRHKRDSSKENAVCNFKLRAPRLGTRQSILRGADRAGRGAAGLRREERGADPPLLSESTSPLLNPLQGPKRSPAMRAPSPLSPSRGGSHRGKSAPYLLARGCPNIIFFDSWVPCEKAAWGLTKVLQDAAHPESDERTPRRNISAGPGDGLRRTFPLTPPRGSWRPFSQRTASELSHRLERHNFAG